jgi:hypothetical protein
MRATRHYHSMNRELLLDGSTLPPPDERQRSVRDSANPPAYRWLLGVWCGWFGYLNLASLTYFRQVGWWLPQPDDYGALSWLAVWLPALTPFAIIAWREPDSVDEEPLPDPLADLVRSPGSRQA